MTDWQQTNAPPHSAAGAAFAAANCSTCHTTVTWNTATFDHSTTGFALTGMHVSPTPTPCISCHVTNNYTLSSTACYGCHITDWQSTTTLGGAVPNHITAGFPTDCSICHSTTNWTSSSFNHSTTTFPLTGAHTTVACALCHVNGNYTARCRPIATVATPPTGKAPRLSAARCRITSLPVIRPRARRAIRRPHG